MRCVSGSVERAETNGRFKNTPSLKSLHERVPTAAARHQGFLKCPNNKSQDFVWLCRIMWFPGWVQRWSAVSKVSSTKTKKTLNLKP